VRPEAIAEYISRYDKAIEVCVGNYWEVARLLGNKLIAAVDVKKTEVPAGIRFYIDDVTSPKLDIYRKADVIYSIRPPPELWNDILALAMKANADCLIRPMGNEFLNFPFKLVNYKGERFYIAERNSII